MPALNQVAPETNPQPGGHPGGYVQPNYGSAGTIVTGYGNNAPGSGNNAPGPGSNAGYGNTPGNNANTNANTNATTSTVGAPAPHLNGNPGKNDGSANSGGYGNNAGGSGNNPGYGNKPPASSPQFGTQGGYSSGYGLEMHNSPKRNAVAPNSDPSSGSVESIVPTPGGDDANSNNNDPFNLNGNSQNNSQNNNPAKSSNSQKNESSSPPKPRRSLFNSRWKMAQQALQTTTKGDREKERAQRREQEKTSALEEKRKLWLREMYVDPQPHFFDWRSEEARDKAGARPILRMEVEEKSRVRKFLNTL